MAVLQHYYTSFVNRENGSAGFQVKAMSNNISPETQSTITRLISYRIPPTLDEYQLADHPIALRYFYKNSGEAILLCSQSNGTDENGRPGNFFAHSLVVDPNFLANMPPILYWRSPFWRTKDPGTSSVIAPLSSLEEIEASFDVEGVWSFLARGNRIEQFYKLMCAVVHCNNTQRRIVIIDKADNVAQWIAAVSVMLPPACRPLLTFATYHHDPYQSQFMITGTSTDSSFRASPDEYMSFFILNTETGKMSEVEDSAYANEAKKAASSFEKYENNLLRLITTYQSRFPPFTRIDEQLDLLALYAGLLEQHYDLSLNPAQLEAVKAALDTFEQQRNFKQENLDELQQISGILFDTYKAQGDEVAYAQYRRVVGLRKQHKMPTDLLAMDELKYATKSLMQNGDRSSLDKMRQTYGDEMFLSTVNSANYLQWLSGFPESDNTTGVQLKRVWQYLGPDIFPSQSSQRFVLASLSVPGNLWIDKQTRKEARELFDVIAQAMGGKEKDWLRILSANNARLPEGTLLRFYCILVGPLELNQRLTYRSIMQSAHADIVEQEMNYDISHACNKGLSDGLSMLEQWIDHARQQRIANPQALVDKGLKRLVSTAQQPAFQQGNTPGLYGIAPQILVSRTLAPLPQGWEDRFISIALSRVSLSEYKPADIEMCKKYKDRPGISSETRTVIDGLLAMMSGELNEELAGRLYKRFQGLDMKQRRAESSSFIQEFLPVCISAGSHQLLIDDLFDWDHYEYFWDPYWETLMGLFRLETSRQAIKLLSFWFNSSPESFTQPYILHYFFLNLPGQLEAARENRGFQEVAGQLQARNEKQRPEWYPLVQDYFSGRKNLLKSFGQNIALQFQRRGTNADEAKLQQEREQKEREAVEERAGKVFQSKDLVRSHEKLISECYDWGRRSLFWAAYWESVKNLLGSRDAGKALELLSFWFEDSFTVFKKAPYIPQEFFLDLYSTMEDAQKLKGFRDNARQIKARVEQKRTYPWFALIQSFFEESEKKFGLFRR